MTSESAKPRYEMVNVRPGHVIVEHDGRSRAVRSYFSAEPSPPVEEYWEGVHIWKHWGTAQSFQFDVLDHETGGTITFKELLGLLYYGCCQEDSAIRQIGELAHDNKISIYIAITYEAADGAPTRLSGDKIAILNRLFNDRLRGSQKKVLILPDLFDLYKTMSYGQIMIDFGLTSMEEGR